jgi:hypothetical protein
VTKGVPTKLRQSLFWVPRLNANKCGVYPRYCQYCVIVGVSPLTSPQKSNFIAVLLGCGDYTQEGTRTIPGGYQEGTKRVLGSISGVY